MVMRASSGLQAALGMILLFLSDESLAFSFKTPSSTLMEGLGEEERTNVRVYQKCSPSVAYVTSVIIPRGSNKESVTSPQKGAMGLGSGSGFVVEDDGYLITNYHVVQRAWQLNTIGKESGERLFPSLLYGNDTSKSLSFVPEAFSKFAKEAREKMDRPRSQVLVRVNSSTNYNQASIVGVAPDLDMAVLKIETNGSERFQNLELGSSSDLLVGQGVVAIGNPFGLDQTVTTGVVSAVGREVTGVAGNKIRNCVQTDAAINPGNSGGPLLDNKGKLIGINTMIISTSGSSSGVGFAIPIDEVRREIDKIISKHRVDNKIRPPPGWIGVDLGSSELKLELSKSLGLSIELPGVLVANVKPKSPAFEAGIQGLRFSSTGQVEMGDRIVAIGGNIVNDTKDLENDFKSRVVGEIINMTLETLDGNRRVVEMKLVLK